MSWPPLEWLTARAPGDVLRAREALTAAVLDSVAAHVVVVDHSGTIIAVNEPWQRFAIENSPTPPVPSSGTGVGTSYVGVCRAATKRGDPYAGAAELGLASVLAGTSPRFSLEYPCHSPTESRWFVMVASPLGGGDLGAVVTHTNVSPSAGGEQVRDNEALLEHAGQLALVGGWELDVASLALHWTTETHRIHEVPPGYVPRFDTSLDFYTPEARPVIAEAMRRAMGDGTPFDVELPLATYTGRPLWVRVLGEARMHHGRAVKLFGAFQDITERKRAEEALRTSEAQLASITATVPGAIYTFRQRPDGSGQAPYVSPGFSDLFGLEPSVVRDDVSAAFARIHPDDRPSVVASIRESGRTRSPCRAEYRLIHPSRGVIWLESRATPVAEPDGSLLWHGIVQDVTVRRSAQEALRATESRYADLVNNIDGIVWEADAQTFQFRFVSDQAERLLGYPVSMWTQEDFWSDHIHPDDRERAVDYCLASTARGASHDFEYRMVKADGRVIWLRDIVSVMLRDGRPDTIRGVMVDITAQKEAEAQRHRLEEQLRESQKMESIGQLAGGVAHDFNNLLTVIEGHVALAAMVEYLPADAMLSLHEIGQAAARAAGLTRQLLAFSRRQLLQPRRVNLNTVVADLVRLLRRTLGETLTIRLDMRPDLPLIGADPSMLEQVLMNLAVNARDAMPGGGELRVATTSVVVPATDPDGGGDARPGLAVCLTVADTGQGIADEHLDRIFEPFFTTKAVGKGTGLGLSTVFGIVKQHGGWIRVASRVGVGTTFDVFFPAVDGQLAAAAPVARPTVRGGAETILVVEDEGPLRHLVVRVLERQGYRVLSAASGAAALPLWRSHRDEIDLLFTDVVMPDGMSGPELARALLAERPELRVIYASGYSGVEAMDMAGGDFLAKPFLPDALLRSVREALDRPPSS